MNSQSCPYTKNNVGDFTMSHLQLCSETPSQKKYMVLAQNRYMKNWNRIEDTKINPHKYDHLGFGKTIKKISPLNNTGFQHMEE